MKAVTDIKQLFWWGRPDLMMLLTQICYFENSISICLILFSFYVDKEGWIYSDLTIGVQPPLYTDYTLHLLLLTAWDALLLVIDENQQVAVHVLHICRDGPRP
jgi:Mlo family